MFNTKILTYSNEEIIIPNSEILSAELINYSAMPLRRVVIDVPVPYRCKIAEIRKLLLECVSDYKYVVSSPAPSVVLTEYGESALKISVRAWTPNDNYWDTLYDLQENIFTLLTEQGIEIPFNQLDVHIMNPDDGNKQTGDTEKEHE